jgi:mannitol/fructose-specific phosphotransferase system IIA component (Ntr-type)
LFTLSEQGCKHWTLAVARLLLNSAYISGEMPRATIGPMDLGDILGPDQIITELTATNRWEAIDELINNLVSTGKIKSEHHDAISAVVKKRESSMSTGIGFGIGIPHASTDLIYEVVGALGRSKKGINFDALDNQPVNLVMLFLVPQGQFQKHLHTLANIAKLLHRAEFRQSLEEAPDAQAMLKIIREQGRK